jgi:hypothetical protein
MSRRNRRRGAALMEFAMALPFAITLFLGIGDFVVYFWQQTRMEELARLTSAKIAPALAGYAAADTDTLARAARTLQETVRTESGQNAVSIQISRHYACPLPNGSEKNLTSSPQLCDGERVYLRVASDQAVTPLFGPLRLLGYPQTAFSRHFLRIR